MGTLLLRLRHGRRLAVGSGVRAGRDVRVEAAPGARVVLGDGCEIGAGTRLVARGGELRVGRGAVIGERCVLVAHAGIEIGDGCRVGDWVSIADFEPVDTDAEAPLRAQGVRAVPVRLGARSVVDHGARLLAGATVAEGARVDAGAVVGA
jgi:acetyltransferase-like isoleucine patch superfamily enzyme